jgi:tyrosine-protein phosphatase SIW14
MEREPDEEEKTIVNAVGHLPRGSATVTSSSGHPPPPRIVTIKMIPPLNFAMVCKGIYRSGHPIPKNFGFLKVCVMCGDIISLKPFGWV